MTAMMSNLSQSVFAANNANRAPVKRKPSKAKSVIMIFNCGGPSHLDLWDMKPNAGSDVRGEFRPVSTNVAGIKISELMPSLTKHVDKLAILRTIKVTQGNHNSGMYCAITGKPYPIDSTLINPSRTDVPSFGTMINWLSMNHGYSGDLPAYVITPKPHCDSFKYITPGQFGACFGPKYDPFVVNANPNDKNFKVANLGLTTGLSNERIQSRDSLLTKFDQIGASLTDPSIIDMNVNNRRAMSMISSNKAQEAFDLSQESQKIRDRYGRHEWGQSHLLARRLVEAGVPFISTVNGPSITWDTHKDNFASMKNRLVPPMEQAYSALLEDLDDRGLLDETIVIWMSDFGRTPKINKDVGRDHWPPCNSWVMAGGGVKGGQAIGESDSQAAYAKSRPLTPADVHASIYDLLGYDSTQLTYPDGNGRPNFISEGKVISELS
jgi:hypothetical protein